MIRKACAFDPGQRYASADEMLEVAEAVASLKMQQNAPAAEVAGS